LTKETSIKELQKQNMTATAYDRIKQAIMLGKLKPGYRFSANQLVTQFGMSRTPIREAIQLLAHENLVELQKGAGFFVKSVTLRELHEITEVRIALECMALRTSLHEISKAELDSLISRWKEVRQEYLDGTQTTIGKILSIDKETHHLFTHRTKNAYLINLLENISLRVHRIQSLSLDIRNAVKVAEQHIEILEFMQKKDVQKALESLERNIQSSLNSVLENLGQHGGEDPVETFYLKDIFDTE